MPAVWIRVRAELRGRLRPALVMAVVRPTVPWVLVLGLGPLALLIANLVAAGPALAAGRIRPASVLRSE